MRYSVIIPVYNRPDEADELLQSLTRQSFKDFEVIIVEDGSSVPCKDVAERYQNILDIRYYAKPNSGPGQTRNYGAERSQGEYLIILDSDCILPEGYFAAVEEELQKAPTDAFGGPDRAHVSFTDIQKAINYSMTSFFTTGGIRGEKRKWTNSIRGVSIWECVARFMKRSAASPGCVSERTSTSVSASSRAGTHASFFPEHGCIISGGRT